MYVQTGKMTSCPEILLQKLEIERTNWTQTSGVFIKSSVDIKNCQNVAPSPK